ncbi:hypothetical protein AX15_001039 [Amanita polypyramis BW_CC]|nr:hypothetical protein AX15_001039 [Amanita polypyramis BW_CC]
MLGRIDEPLWFIIRIFVISALFTLTFAHFGNSPNMAKQKVPQPAYLANFRMTQALKLKRQQRKIQPFRFMDLPFELRMAILSHISGTDKASRLSFISLLFVSKDIQCIVLRACLPNLAIKLTTRRQVLSFHTLCFNHSHIARLIHHLWISPLNEEDEFPSCRIIRSCVNVRSLACNARLLAASVCWGRELKHGQCREFTLLMSELGWEYTLPEQVGTAFLNQLTHLRVVGDLTVPRGFPCKCLTHLSFTCPNGAEDRSVETVTEIMDRRREIYPQLRMVVVTDHWRRRNEMRRRGALVCSSPRVLVFHIPGDVIEVDLWCDGVGDKSIWDKANEALVRT